MVNEDVVLGAVAEAVVHVVQRRGGVRGEVVVAAERRSGDKVEGPVSRSESELGRCDSWYI